MAQNTVSSAPQLNRRHELVRRHSVFRGSENDPARPPPHRMIQLQALSQAGACVGPSALARRFLLPEPKEWRASFRKFELPRCSVSPSSCTAASAVLVLNHLGRSATATAAQPTRGQYTRPGLSQSRRPGATPGHPEYCTLRVWYGMVWRSSGNRSVWTASSCHFELFLDF